MRLYTHLNFGGNCEAVIHARLSVAGAELIGNDVPSNYFQPIRSSYVYLAVDSSRRASGSCVTGSVRSGRSCMSGLAEGALHIH